jgi:single-strand selective monofunctional uracil DNA glycosylase
VGRFAESRLREVLGEPGEDGNPEIGTILHPSPASPAANRGWAEQAEAQLRELGVELP